MGSGHYNTLETLDNPRFQKIARDYYIKFVQAKQVFGDPSKFDPYGDVYEQLPKIVKEILKFRAKQQLVEVDIPAYWNDESVRGEG